MVVKSILSEIGHGLKVFFEGAAKVAVAAEPIVDIAFPGIAPLYNSTVAAVSKAESLAIAAGTQTGTGAQKLAIAVAEITPVFLSYAKQNGINVSGDTITAYVTAVVQTLNVIPPANPATPAPTAS